MAKEKENPVVRYAAITAAINRAKESYLPPFPRKFYLINRSLDVKEIIEEFEDGVVRFVGEDAVIDAILCYCSNTLVDGKKYSGYLFDHAQAKKAMLFWRSFTTPIAMPKLLLEKSEKGLCFNRLPYNSENDVFKAPLFQEFLSRCDNAKALMIFLGSLFFEDSDRQQYIWMWGQGGDGKGSLIKVLRAIFADQYHSEEGQHVSSRFWTHGLLDKRIVVFPDCNNYMLPLTGIFKMVTGEDPIRVEPKGRNSYTAELRCKVMVVSQQPPQISSQEAEFRRLILCQVQPPGVVLDFSYKDRLMREAPYIIGTCKAAYLDNLLRGGAIPVEREAMELLALEAEVKYETFFNEFLVEDPLNTDGISGETMISFFAEKGIRDGAEIRNYLLYMARKHGVIKKKTSVCIKYTGVGVKSHSIREMERAKRIEEDFRKSTKILPFLK
jgi:hypothetical protein